jgi:peptidoglycan/xylan/chitin deacetylase (PgdA/CDA1 family)
MVGASRLDTGSEQSVIPILMYHQIADVPRNRDPRHLAVSPRLFERQMAYLSREGYRCISVEDAIQHPHERRAVVLTFDDGFRDLYHTVRPILERYGFTATIFLVAGCMGQPSNWEDQSGPYSGELLSWDDARELAQAGFTLGSHTINHPRLTELSQDRAAYEIRGSKQLLQEHLGVEINLFAYPYSDHTGSIRQLVAESGYIAACGGDRGQWDLFNLWRAPCAGNDSLFSFAAKVNGWYTHFIQMRQQPVLRRVFRRPARAMKQLWSSS